MLDVPEIPDADWKKLYSEEQDAYNHKIELRNEYNTAKENYEISISLFDPGILIIIGIVGLFLASFLFLFGLLILIIGVIWAFLRVMERSHAYQRYKDTESALKLALSDKS
jgi:hypothetical protein